jgi:hypothetical protein
MPLIKDPSPLIATLEVNAAIRACLYAIVAAGKFAFFLVKVARKASY